MAMTEAEQAAGSHQEPSHSPGDYQALGICSQGVCLGALTAEMGTG